MVLLGLLEPLAQILVLAPVEPEVVATERPPTPRLNGLVKTAPQTLAEVQAQASSAMAVTAAPALSSSPFRGLFDGSLR